MRAAVVVLTAFLTVVAAPTVAQAASTVSVEGGVLTVATAPGETNALSIRPTPAPDYEVTDDAGVTAGAGCSASGSAVVCPAAGVQRIVARLGDGNDRAFWDGGSSTIPYEFSGEAGRDQLSAANHSAPGTLLDGGEGNDQLLGAADIARGGAGDDTVVATRLLEGGDGNDTLAKSSVDAKAGRLDAGSGDDRLQSKDGVVDELSCGAGRDVVVQADDSERPDSSCESGKGVARKIIPRVTVFELPKGRSKPRRGRLAVWMKCSVPRCAVTVQIRAAGDVHQKHFVRFRPRQAPIRRLVIGNKAKLVRLRLSPAQRRGLRRQGRYDPVATNVTAKGPGGRSLLLTDGLFCTRRDPCTGTGTGGR